MSFTSAALTAPLAAFPPATASTFARRRLRLGIAGVGVSVVFALIWLLVLAVLGAERVAAWRLGPGWVGVVGTAAAGALAFTVTHALLALPLEHAGGRRAVRQVPAFGAWLRAWARGTALLVALASVGSAAVVVGGTIGGAAGAAAVALTCGALVLAAQGPLARMVAALGVRAPSAAERDIAAASGIDPDAVRVVITSDEAFVGGWIGIGPWRTLWVPERWCAHETSDLLRVQLRRRQAQLASLARRRGWWRAAAWPALGVLVLSSLIPWGWQDPRMWLAIPALGTLWAFFGVLVLPAASRPAVFAADAMAARALGSADVSRAVARLDHWQDDEPERSPLVEFVFHPVPAAARRMRALDAGQPHTLGGGHQLARLALLAGLAGGSVLGRMVHCNLGRPSLWVVYPGD